MSHQSARTCGCAVAFLCVCLAACDATRPDPLASAVRAHDEDSKIVEAAALEFLKSGDCREGEGKDGIVVVDETLSGSDVSSWIRAGELDSSTWRDDLMLGLPGILDRNHQETTIDWHFADQATIRDVVLRGVASDAIRKAAMLGKCVITFALPGIYADGKRATVVFDVAPEFHGRLVISSLRLVDGAWHVERRHDFEYL